VVSASGAGSWHTPTGVARRASRADTASGGLGRRAGDDGHSAVLV